MNKKFFLFSFAFMVVYAISLPSAYHFSPESYKTRCGFAMTRLKEAVGRYRREKGEYPVKDTAGVLLAGFLDVYPRCPDSGNFQILLLKDGSDVSCSVHGDLSRQYGDQRSMGFDLHPNSEKSYKMVTSSVFVVGLLIIYYFTKK